MIENTTTVERLIPAEVNIISKITMRTIGCIPGKIEPLARIFGKATNVKDVESEAKDGSMQTFKCIEGMFEAINLQTGELFQSGKLYLPGGMHEMAVKGIESLEKGDVLEFALDIRSVQSSNKVGYAYEARPLVAPTKADELEAMRKLLPALPTGKPLPYRTEKLQIAGPQVESAQKEVAKPVMEKSGKK